MRSRRVVIWPLILIVMLAVMILFPNFLAKDTAPGSTEFIKKEVSEVSEGDPRLLGEDRKLPKVQTEEEKKFAKKVQQDYRLGKKSFSAIQGYGPRLVSKLQAASVRHQVNLVKQSHKVSAQQEGALEDLYSQIFIDRAEGKEGVEEFEQQQLEAIIGVSQAEEYFTLKSNLQVAEVSESVERRIGVLEEDLSLDRSQSELVRAALLRLEESRQAEKMTREKSDPKAAHKKRVQIFESELSELISPSQFKSYLESKPAPKKKPGINPFMQ